jgi:hypothetical protein
MSADAVGDAKAVSNRETCIGAQRSRSAGVRTPH